MKGQLKEKRLRVLLFEGEGARPLGDEQRLETLTALLEDGHCVTRIAEEGAVAQADDSEHLLVGDFVDAPPAREGVRVVPMTEPEALKESLRSEIAEAGGVASGAWKPWFPVIDYDRCTNCMQCLTFCLFDVYGVRRQGADPGPATRTTARPTARPARASAPRRRSSSPSTRRGRSTATSSAKRICRARR